MANTDFIAELGEIALGSRLKRLGEVFTQAANAFYRNTGIAFEARWFTILYAVARKGPVSVTEVAEMLGVTHPAVVQIVKELESNELISSTSCQKDCRKRILAITDKGRNLLGQLEPLINAFREVNKQLLTTQSHNLLSALKEMEKLFEEKSYSKRLAEVLERE